MSLVIPTSPRFLRRSVVCATSLLLAVFATSSVSAQLNAFDSGRYDDTGFHDTEFEGYMTGVFDDTFVFRSFFAFDVSALLADGPLTTATLALYNPADGFGSDEGAETLDIRGLDTSTAGMASLLDGSAGLDGFDALGSGTLFGSAILTEADNSMWVKITLNQAFLDFANGSAGGSIVLGASLSSLSGDDFGFNEYVFAGSDGSPRARIETGDFTPIPEPSTYALGALLLFAGVIAVRRAREGRARAAAASV